ncbi:MAG: tRNA pseudouridine synthase A, partial [Pseudomonadota bacterium]|nr:tRNA pseudouridine synthase A [Pseudomonadota bacterium]
MTRFAFTVEFDGRPFMGWQRQAHGPSVQQTIEDAIAAVTGAPGTVHAAGRTDAGVHGLAMRAHADIAKPITPFRLMEALNARMRPAPVAILACEAVPDDWHARFSCVGRSYVCRIANRRAPLTFEAGLVWRVVQPLDAGA